MGSHVDDPRPKRTLRPKLWKVIVMLVLTPGCAGIPIIGWFVLAVAWAMTVRQYLSAKVDESYPVGHFRGE